MDRSTHSTSRPKHLEQNLNRLNVDTGNNKPTSISQIQTAPPTLRNIKENSGKITYPSIQIKEHKNSIIRHDDDSSIVESSSSSYSDQDVNEGLKKTASEPTLISRPSSGQKKNGADASELQSIPFFEHMPEDVFRKILFENLIDLNKLPATAKNLMHFASISKFNREYVRVLLTEEGMREVSFEITKSVIPNLLATLANDKKAKFTQTDIDYLVRNYPYLTVDCSYQKSIKFTNRGLEALKKIVSHTGLQEIRIISNLPANNQGVNESFTAYSNNCLDLIYSLLSRKSSTPVKVDLIFKNWLPPLNSKNELEDKSFDTIKKIQNKANRCDNVIFGEINLIYKTWDTPVTSLNFNPFDTRLLKYQFNFIKMMCNIAVTHSAHTICLKCLGLFDADISLILNEFIKFDKSSLRHLDLSRNHIEKATAQSLIKLLQSEKTFLNTLKLNDCAIRQDELDILNEEFKRNQSLELVEIKNIDFLPHDHPIRDTKKVKFT
jgi:hypothetical protein